MGNKRKPNTWIGSIASASPSMSAPSLSESPVPGVVFTPAGGFAASCAGDSVVLAGTVGLGRGSVR